MRAKPNASTAFRRTREAIVLAVQEKLRRAGLTLYRVASLTRQRYPKQSSYHIRRNLYFQIRSGFSPTLEQVVAFAELTDRPMREWLTVFGFSLSDIPYLQATMARIRTAPIDHHLIDTRDQLPLFHYRNPHETLASTTPLSRLLTRSGSKEASAFLESARTGFVYVKIGKEDRLAYPEVLPGSIVRADPSLIQPLLPRSTGEPSRHVFLVRSTTGYFCTRLRQIAHNRFAPVILDPQLHRGGLSADREIQILGVVDLEFRFRRVPTKSPRTTDRLPRNTLIRTGTRVTGAVETPLGPGALMLRARRETGMSLRAASERSRAVATALGDSRYFASPGTLSDYEASLTLPRHIHKLLTIAIVYAVSLRQLLGSVGIQLFATASREQSEVRTRGQGSEKTQSADFLARLFQQYGDVPLFLTSALPTLTGLASVSIRDAFWIAGRTGQEYPPIKGALFVLINRRSKNPRFYAETPLYLQPLYLLQDRGGSCYLANCAREAGRVVVYADSQTSAILPPAARDAEVLGEVVAVARRLLRSM